jgi:hypothetical protein
METRELTDAAALNTETTDEPSGCDTTRVQNLNPVVVQVAT